MTSTSSVPAPWTCTLHMEVRSRGRPGRPALEQRVYTATAPANTTNPDDAVLQMIYTYEGTGFTSQSVETLRPTEVDIQARTAVYHESRARSDKFVDRLEDFGWTRVS